MHIANTSSSFFTAFTEEEITVKRTVERLKFANPHVIIYFNVTAENSEQTEWQSESQAATLLRNQDWDKRCSKKGNTIRITGNSTCNDSPMVSTDTIGFIDSKTGEVTGILAH